MKKTKKQNKNLRAKIKHRKEKTLRNMDEDSSTFDSVPCYVYDIRLKIKHEVAFGKTTKEDEVYSLERHNIDIFNLRQLLEKLEEITSLIDLGEEDVKKQLE